MKRRSLFPQFAVSVALLMFPVLSHAQGGCENSPENPTVVLALIGSAAASVSALRRRMRAGKRPSFAGGAR